MAQLHRRKWTALRPWSGRGRRFQFSVVPLGVCLPWVERLVVFELGLVVFELGLVALELWLLEAPVLRAETHGIAERALESGHCVLRGLLVLCNGRQEHVLSQWPRGLVFGLRALGCEYWRVCGVHGSSWSPSRGRAAAVAQARLPVS
jgi:hypothetical protein